MLMRLPSRAGEPPVTCLFPVHVVEAHPLRLFGQRGAVLQEQAARLRMEIALALEDEIFRTGFQGDDPHVVHDPGEEEPFPLLGGKAEAFGQPVEKETPLACGGRSGPDEPGPARWRRPESDHKA